MQLVRLFMNMELPVRVVWKYPVYKSGLYSDNHNNVDLVIRTCNLVNLYCSVIDSFSGSHESLKRNLISQLLVNTLNWHCLTLLPSNHIQLCLWKLLRPLYEAILVVIYKCTKNRIFNIPRWNGNECIQNEI